MLRYKVESVPGGFGEAWINKHIYVVRDLENKIDIATCYKKKDADKICLALNFYNDWILVDGWTKDEAEERAKEKLDHYCE